MRRSTTDLSDPDALIDIADLAEMADVSATRIRQILDEHAVPRPAHGKAHFRKAFNAIAISFNPTMRAKHLAERVDYLEAELRKAAKAKA